MTFFQDEIVNKSLRHLFIRCLFPLRVSENSFVLVMKVPAIFSLVYLLLPSFFSLQENPWVWKMKKVKIQFHDFFQWFIDLSRLLGLKRFTLDCSCCKTFNAPPIMSPNHESPPPDDFTKVQSNAMKTTSIFLKIVQKWVH